MLYLGHTYTKKLSVVYLKFKCPGCPGFQLAALTPGQGVGSDTGQPCVSHCPAFHRSHTARVTELWPPAPALPLTVLGAWPPCQGQVLPGVSPGFLPRQTSAVPRSLSPCLWDGNTISALHSPASFPCSPTHLFCWGIHRLGDTAGAALFGPTFWLQMDLKKIKVSELFEKCTKGPTGILSDLGATSH